MSLSSIKAMKSSKGFTIVELLIVIVVIGILAAIVIVAFNGVQNRAKATAGETLAKDIVKKLESYNSVNGAYPTLRSQIQGTVESKISGLATGSPIPADTKPIIVAAGSDSLFSTALDATTANSGESVRIAGNAAGGNVYYWDYSAATPAEVAIPYPS